MSGGMNGKSADTAAIDETQRALMPTSTDVGSRARRFTRTVTSQGEADGDCAAPRMLTPRERLEALCDPGTLQLIRTGVRSRSLGDRAAAGDGVLGAYGAIGGRPVFCYAQDARVVGGSLGEAHADTIVRVMELALNARAPVVGFVESAGARMQEGTRALGAFGRVFKANVALSGRVPQLTVVTGCSAGGGVYSPALTDLVILTEQASLFLTGPKVVREVTGEDVSAEALGGPRVHERNGVGHLVADDDVAACRLARTVLSYLGQSSHEPPAAVASEAREMEDPSEPLPPETFRVYDVRDVARRLVDRGSLLELSPKWARNMVTAFARLDGWPVGIVANQPRYLGGVIDAAAAEKGARFVRMCNAYGLPLIVLVDTPGFLPGTKQESAGIIRRGAKLLFAFIEAEVPKISVVLRQGYGGGFITMNCKDIGADYAFAWPQASIGVMGARQAVGVIDRRRIAAAEDPQAEVARLAENYALEHQRAAISAEDGVVDEIVEPVGTRERLIGALASLRGKPRTFDPFGNIPL